MIPLTKAGTFPGPGSSKIMTDKLNRFWPLIASAAFAILVAANAVLRDRKPWAGTVPATA